MDETELKGLRRRVGRMGYEEVRKLFEEARATKNAHDDCLLCEYQTGYNYPDCPERNVLSAEFLASRPLNHALLAAQRRHEKTCPTCTAGRTQWWERVACPEFSRLCAIEQLYSRRLSHLEHKEHLRQFEQAHGRPPKDKIELLNFWLSAEKGA